MRLTSLNPYFNGKYFWRLHPYIEIKNPLDGLNPYFNGKYFWRVLCVMNVKVEKVLILILMENTFRVCKRYFK